MFESVRSTLAEILASGLPVDRRTEVVRRLLADDTHDGLTPIRQVDYRGQKLAYNTVSPSTVWRVENFVEAEPETLDWLAGLSASDVLFDVGANVGTYSIVAAKIYGSKVFAFEPESKNYATLNRNIISNQCANLVTAYNLAIMDKMVVDELNISYVTTGAALNAFGDPLRVPEAEGLDKTQLETFQPQHRQGCVAFAIDDLIARGLPTPTFLKIDVDNFEDRVLAGAQQLLASAPKLTILVETSEELPAHRQMLQDLEALGYRSLRQGVNRIYARG